MRRASQGEAGCLGFWDWSRDGERPALKPGSLNSKAAHCNVASNFVKPKALKIKTSISDPSKFARFTQIRLQDHQSRRVFIGSKEMGSILNPGDGLAQAIFEGDPRGPAPKLAREPGVGDEAADFAFGGPNALRVGRDG